MNLFISFIGWFSRVKRPTKHIIGHIRDGFYGSNDPINIVKALKEVVVLRVRLQSHKVHLIMLQYYTMQYTVIHKIHKNESKHSEMSPLRQNPIQRTVRSVHVCALYCAQLLHSALLYRTDVITTSGYATWFTAGGAIRIAHYDVIDDVITRKL